MIPGRIGQGATTGSPLVAAYVIYRTGLFPVPLGVKERAVHRRVRARVRTRRRPGSRPRLDVNWRILAGGYEEVDAGSARGWDYDYLFFQLMNSEIMTRRFYDVGAGRRLALFRHGGRARPAAVGRALLRLLLGGDRGS